MTSHPQAPSSALASHGVGAGVLRAVGMLALLAALATTVSCRGASPARTASRSATTPTATAVPLKSEAEIRDLDIQYYEARAARDPSGGSDLAHVAALELARSRESGDPRDAIAAEVAARRSLHNRGERNAPARQVLAAALLAQHRFAESLAITRSLRDDAPDSPSLQAAAGEIEMELGQYDSARASFRRVRVSPNDLSVVPRLSRWAEIEGDTAKARRLIRLALASAIRSPTLPREQVGWFWLRAGDIELRAGRPLAADSAYRHGLALHPGDYRILSALARSAAAQGRWRDAIERGETAIATVLDPATLGTLSDAYAALGDTARSEEYAHALEVAVTHQPGAYHRAWSLFLLDHDRRVAGVTRRIREELRTRRDVYGYDLLAWALHKQGHDTEAAGAARLALREGTLDALLFYHAGMIDAALGDTAAARAHLTKALAINAYFQPFQPAVARATLASLRVGGGLPASALAHAGAPPRLAERGR